MNEGGMHQSRKNECAIPGQGLNLSLSYFWGMFTSIRIQKLLSGNYKSKYHLKAMDRNTKIPKLCSVLYFSLGG